jgi:hypothetical protein
MLGLKPGISARRIKYIQRAATGVITDASRIVQRIHSNKLDGNAVKVLNEENFGLVAEKARRTTHGRMR